MTVTDPFLLAADIFDPPAHPYADDPVGYARDVLSFDAWSKQQEIMESVRDHQRTAVRACHGPGKTGVAAQIVLWFLAAHRNSRVITTAPTWAQVEELLWREIRGAVGRAHTAGKGTEFPTPNLTKLELGDEWFAIGLSTNQPERFQGHHADHLLLVVDESSGVKDDIFEAAEGFQTAAGARMLLLGNPNSPQGQFYRAFSKERERWNTIHISIFDTPNFTGESVPGHVARSMPTREWEEDARRTYGAESPMYQVRALGNFPSTTEKTVIGLGLVEQAQRLALPAPDSTQDLVVISCDVARFGDDETVICERVGQTARIVDTYVGKKPPASTATGPQQGDLVATAARIAAHASKHPRPHVRIVVDDTGVGGGVTDILRNDGWQVTAFNGSDQAFEPLRFPNRRSELWFQVAAQLEDIDLDTNDQLAADLTGPQYTYDLKLRRVVEKKADTKKRLGRSPDRADAMNLLFVPERASAHVVLPSTPPRSPIDGRSLPDLRRRSRPAI